jgi:hypothetical protein
VSAYIIKRAKRSGSQGGDPAESERLIRPFLAWAGRRSNAVALKLAGIEYGHGSRWLSRTGVLADRYQIAVRKLLDEAGVEQSPCS